MAELRKRGQRSESFDWDTLQDASISYLAQGILTYVLSLPPNWNFSAERIARARKKEGKDAILKALRELELAGYRRVTTERGEDGRIRTYADFSYTPVPEWIEAAKRRAAKKKLQKKPGPKAMGSAAKQAALESLKGSDAHETEFPQVAPEVGIPDSGALDSGQPAETDVSAGRTGSGDTGIRSPGLLRGFNREVQPQRRATEAEIPEQREAETVVVVVESTDPKTAAAAKAVLSRSNPIGWARMTDTEQCDLIAKVAALVERGWPVAALTQKLNGRTDEGTRLPYRILTKSLAGIGEPPAVASSAPRAEIVVPTDEERAAAEARRVAEREERRRASTKSPSAIREAATKRAVELGMEPAAAEQWVNSQAAYKLHEFLEFDREAQRAQIPALADA